MTHTHGTAPPVDVNSMNSWQEWPTFTVNRPIDPAVYKLQKEDFVSGLAGTSMYEVALVTSVPMIGYVIHALWAHIFRFMGISFVEQPIPATILHFVLVELPLLLVFLYPQFTLFSVLPTVLLITVLMMFVVTKCKSSSLKKFISFLPHDHQDVTNTNLATLNSSRKPFLSSYRALMMISTCIAILAVDFQAFPRRFAKTETFGFSVMDSGVGSFIVSHALVSPLARVASSSDNNVKKASKPLWLRVFQNVSPMLLLGSIRFFLVKSVEYQEHVSEYGAHWNFFFTLGVVALFSALVNPPPPFARWIAAALIIGYQVTLSNFGLTEYIMSAPRVDFVSANKEGICSSIGYFALYLFGVEIGHFFNKPTNANGWYKRIVRLFVLDLLLYAGAYLAHTYIQESSRRMHNLAYLLWILALNMQHFFLFLVANVFLTNANPGYILDAVNSNQLFIFLISNLSTGAINLSIYTLYMADNAAVFILVCYLFAVCSVAAFCKAFKINTKFWA